MRSFFWLILLFLVTNGLYLLGEEIFFSPIRTDMPPVIDGDLNDEVWKKSKSFNQFQTMVPEIGKETSEKTSAYFAYDGFNLYFAYKCYDREPEKIKAAISGRDTIENDDFVCINLDSFNDHQAVYTFYVNPYGIQMDSRYANGNEDRSMDFIWHSAGRMDTDGYSVEIRIPFKSIRYDGRNRVQMAVMFERYISRYNEHDTCPGLIPERGYAFLTQMLPFELFDIEPYTLLEVLPALTYSQTYQLQEETLKRNSSSPELSLTGKFGITPRLTVDATWNPDFSQVEADASQVDANLRYDLYFKEKRPFFLEGNDIFLPVGFGPLQALVHTRRIVAPKLGIKLTGKLGQKDTLATIYALEEIPDDEFDTGAEFAHFSIARYRRSLKGDSYIGGFYTDREEGKRFNRVIGVDGQLRVGNSSVLNLHSFISSTRTGESDPIKTGSAWCIDYRYDSNTWKFALGGFDIASDFKTDCGYLTRNGLGGARCEAILKIHTRSRLFRMMAPTFSGYLYRDHRFRMNESKIGINLTNLLTGNSFFNIGLFRMNEVYLGQRFDTSYWRFEFVSQIFESLYLNVFVQRGRLIRYVDSPYPGFGSNLGAETLFQPHRKVQMSLSLTYSDFFRRADAVKDFSCTIWRGKVTYQINPFLFFRAVLEHNSLHQRLLTDFLASFTYIPGTVIHIGYGSLYERLMELNSHDIGRFREIHRGFFFKASYNWRL